MQLYPVDTGSWRFFLPKGSAVVVAPKGSAVVVASFAGAAVVVAAAAVVAFEVSFPDGAGVVVFAVVVEAVVVVGLGLSDGKMGGHLIGTSSPLMNLDNVAPT